MAESRFWLAGGEDSESDEDDFAYGSSSDDEGLGDGDNDSVDDNNQASSFFDAGSSEEEDDARFVKSERAKQFERTEAFTTKILDAVAENDWITVGNEWTPFLRQYNITTKLQLFDKYGYPRFLQRCLVNLSKTVAKMGKNKRAIQGVIKDGNQRKSYIRFQAEFKKWIDSQSELKEKVENFEEGPDEEEYSDEAPVKKSKGDWFMDSDGEDDDGEDTEGPTDDEDDGEEEDDEAKEETWTKEIIEEKIDLLLKQRGKKYDRVKRIARWEKMLVLAENKKFVPGRLLEVKFYLINAILDVNPTVLLPMETEHWRKCFVVLTDILEQVIESDDLVAVNCIDPELVASLVAKDDSKFYVQGNMSQKLRRLGDELFRSLRSLDVHKGEYVDRLKDEVAYYLLLTRAQNYFKEQGKFELVAAMASGRAELLYYRKSMPQPSVTYRIPEKVSVPEDSLAELKICSAVVYKHGTDSLKRIVVIQQVYALAIRDLYFQARDLMLMTHLQDTIDKAEPSAMILFNRAIAQLGLGAFRLGRIYEAQQCLSDLVSSNKIREMLAQGVSRYAQDKTQEQEKQERKRQMPHHLHISTELIEASYLISAMLLEIPNMARRDTRPKLHSKSFRKTMDFHNRQVFRGPPESSKEAIVAAAQAMQVGDWQTAQNHILNLNVWRYVPTFKEKIAPLLTQQIREQTLKTYLFSYGKFYEALGLERLMDLFQLTKSQIHSVVSKMMISDELPASWDQPTGTIVFNRVEPTKLQQITLQLADKATQVIDNTDPDSKSYAHRDNRWQDSRFRYANRRNDRNQKYGYDRNRRK